MRIDINLDKGSVSKRVDSSLMEVYVLDFGDNYHRLSGEPTSEFEMEVRRLKGRYRDLSKFNHALSIYHEWMDYLYDKHGGKDMFKAKYKAGLINDYVPKKPRLKNIKELKYLYKKGIVVSQQHGREIISDEDELDRMVEIYTDQFTNNDEKEIIVKTVEDKKAEDIADSMYGRVHEYAGSSFASDVDYLQAYFMNKNKGKKKKGKKKKHHKKDKKKNKNKKQDPLLITDIMSGYYDKIADESDKAPLTTYNGLLLSTGTTKELDVYHKLSELGWDSYRIMKKAKYGKRVSSMFKVQKKKKKKKKNQLGGSYDDLLIDIMTDNNYSDFDEFQREMLNMTSENIFK